MILMDFSIYPLDKGESLSKYVARALDIIDKSGINYRINPMGTVMEGEWDELMKIAKDCFDAMKKDCSRIIVSIKMDYRKKEGSRLETKITSVEEKVGRKLKK
ncbi:MAG: MTH1187 family thiamine-binding protein [Deltaproteobacteria bacterium]|nr:MTH1187 family thiamine-binding protein [Deltaproteobacteria bacterium]